MLETIPNYHDETFLNPLFLYTEEDIKTWGTLLKKKKEKKSWNLKLQTLNTCMVNPYTKVKLENFKIKYTSTTLETWKHSRLS